MVGLLARERDTQPTAGVLLCGSYAHGITGVPIETVGRRADEEFAVAENAALLWVEWLKCDTTRFGQPVPDFDCVQDSVLVEQTVRRIEQQRDAGLEPRG